MAVEYVPGYPIMKPFVDLDNQEFWDGVNRHELLLQRCRDCAEYYHIPRPMCPHCRSTDTLEWVQSSGKGHIYSYVNFTTDRMAYPALKVPYTVVLVELDEGPRLTSNLVDITPEEVSIGIPVEVVFEEIPDGITIYKFKRREA
ncbi:MAG: Zn-ribbon domain-containing OB-fold protein [Dehalococcoidia bacterium]